MNQYGIFKKNDLKKTGGQKYWYGSRNALISSTIHNKKLSIDIQIILISKNN